MGQMTSKLFSAFTEFISVPSLGSAMLNGKHVGGDSQYRRSKIMANVIHKGAPTTTGGKVLQGNAGLCVEGNEVASVGHMASCKACKKGIGPIVAVGPRKTILPAGPVALEGDYVACGCPPMSNIVRVGQGSTSSDS